VQQNVLNNNQTNETLQQSENIGNELLCCDINKKSTKHISAFQSSTRTSKSPRKPSSYISLQKTRRKFKTTKKLVHFTFAAEKKIFKIITQGFAYLQPCTSSAFRQIITYP